MFKAGSVIQNQNEVQILCGQKILNTFDFRVFIKYIEKD